MTTYSDQTKLAEIERELKMRRRVYPHQVVVRKMKQSEADMLIAIMEAIANDYREKLKA